jgi:hypothetical protein
VVEVAVEVGVGVAVADRVAGVVVVDLREKQMERVLEGKLTVKPAERVSQRGNKYVLFVIRDKDGIHYQCRAFREQADRAKTLLTHHGENLFVCGKVDQTVEDDIRSVLVSSWGFVDEDKQQEVTKKAIRHDACDSYVTEEHKEWMREFDVIYIKRMDGRHEYTHIDNCIQLNERYIDKIDFLHLMFGTEWEDILTAQGYDWTRIDKKNFKDYAALKEAYIEIGLRRLREGERPWEDRAKSSG